MRGGQRQRHLGHDRSGMRLLGFFRQLGRRWEGLDDVRRLAVFILIFYVLVLPFHLFIYIFRPLRIALLHSIPDSRPASMFIHICICVFLRLRIARILTCMFLRHTIFLVHLHGTNVIFIYFIFYRSRRSNCSFRKPDGCSNALG